MLFEEVGFERTFVLSMRKPVSAGVTTRGRAFLPNKLGGKEVIYRFVVL